MTSVSRGGIVPAPGRTCLRAFRIGSCCYQPGLGLPDCVMGVPHGRVEFEPGYDHHFWQATKRTLIGLTTLSPQASARTMTVALLSMVLLIWPFGTLSLLFCLYSHDFCSRLSFHLPATDATARRARNKTAPAWTLS